MSDDGTFLEDPQTTREAIMRATYRALCEHGYADLTIARIGDHFEKSKSLLYHHYDSKDELLLDFLEFMLEEFRQSVPEADDEGPRAHLEAIFDGIFAPELPDERREFTKAMAELRAQAAHDEGYRDYFREHDEFFREQLAEVVAEGVETGVFREVDPDRVGAFLQTIATGQMTQRATADAGLAETVRAELDRYVEAELLAETPDE